MIAWEHHEDVKGHWYRAEIGGAVVALSFWGPGYWALLVGTRRTRFEARPGDEIARREVALARVP